MISIRPATADDCDVLLSLIDALADYEKLERPDGRARERLRRDGFGEHPLFRAYLGELDGAPVAYAITYRTYSSFLALPTLFLEDLFVLPDARGHGVGSALFRHVASQAVDDGCGRMEWVVLDWNRVAIDFYERLGGRRLTEWYTYRLTRERMIELVNGKDAG
jgi:GNAT superfamily N-acetyltransferase